MLVLFCWVSIMQSTKSYKSVLYAECRYAECRYADCRGAIQGEDGCCGYAGWKHKHSELLVPLQEVIFRLKNG